MDRQIDGREQGMEEKRRGGEGGGEETFEVNLQMAAALHCTALHCTRPSGLFVSHMNRGRREEEGRGRGWRDGGKKE